MKKEQTVEEVQAEINAWEGKNKYLWKEARKKLRTVKIHKPSLSPKKEKVVKEELQSDVLSESEFYGLTRKEQKKVLNSLNLSVSYKDKEADLWNKYSEAVY